MDFINKQKNQVKWQQEHGRYVSSATSKYDFLFGNKDGKILDIKELAKRQNPDLIPFPRHERLRITLNKSQLEPRREKV